MDIQTWNETARIVAVFAGVVFGSTAISAASFVWLRKQIFAYGGSALCGSGVILLGLSIWHSVEFGVGPTGMSFKAAQQLAASSLAAAQSADAAAKAVSLLTEVMEPTSPTSIPVSVRPEIQTKLEEAKQQAEEARRQADVATSAARSVVRGDDVSKIDSHGNAGSAADREPAQDTASAPPSTAR